MEIINLVPILIILLAYIPLYLKVWKKEATPNIATFSLWIFTGLTIMLSTYFSGGQIPLISIGFVLANTILVFLLLNKKSFSWGRKENIGLVIVLLSLLVWYFSNAFWGLIAIVFGNYIGAGLPSLIDAFKNPQKTQILTWFLFTFSAALNIFIITNFKVESYIYPVFAFIFNGLVFIAHSKSCFKKDKIFFLDLDNTLYDTLGLSNYNHELMKKEFPNITSKQHFRAEEEVFPKNNNLYDYRIHAENLADIVGGNKEEIINWFEDFYKNEPSEKFVFSDTFDFIKWAKSKGKVVILSFGIEKVQKPRMIKSGIASIVDDYIVTQGNKGEDIRDYLYKNNLKNCEIIFVDDSLKHLDSVKKIISKAKTFHIIRKFSDGNKIEKDHILVKNLEDVKNKLC